MKIICTGGAGFLGSWVVKELVKAGNELIVLDVVKEPVFLQEILPQIIYLPMDLASETDIYRAMAVHQPEGILHLGSLLGGDCEENPIKAYDVNVRSLLILLDASIALGTVKKFLYASSVAIFAPNQLEPVPTEGRIFPVNLYGSTKAAGEFMLNWYSQTYKLDVRALRFPIIWGPRRTSGTSAKFTTFLLDALARNEEIFVENPEEKQAWMYIKDAVAATLAAWNSSEAKTKFYNLSGHVLSMREFMEAAKQVKPEAKIKFADKGKVNLSLPLDYDDGPMRKEFGWQQKYSVLEAIAEHFAETK